MKAQKERGPWVPKDVEKVRGRGFLKESNREGSPKVRLGKEQEGPWHITGPAHTWQATWGGQVLQGLRHEPGKDSQSSALNLYSRLVFRSHWKSTAGDRTIGLCFGKGLLQK